MTDRRVLLSFGHGYSARTLARRLLAEGWRVIGTTRSAEKAQTLRFEGVEPVLSLAEAIERLHESTHLLISAGPDAEGDPVLAACSPAIRDAAQDIEWVGYLSTTGVYGDRQGEWVDETSECHPSTRRGKWRLAAEQAWQSIPGLPLHIFRLAGIYGPGRGPFSKVRNGTARQIIKPGQVFSRTHVEDIASVLQTSMAQPDPGAIYNVCDDLAAPPQDVLAYAAKLLGLPPPPEVDFETADMSPMARSFYAESKRVSNRRIREDLDVELAYPTYREGLAALLAEDERSDLGRQPG
ncbi:MAG: SDR family oxidoreductase [Paracoccaceae bacterium]